MNVIDLAKNGTVVDQALFIMAAGLVGVFVVLTVFYFFIKILERVFRPKDGEAAD